MSESNTSIGGSGATSGPLGDGDLHPGKYNMRLIRRAIKNGWNVPEEYKAAVVEQMAKVATESDDERNRIAASKVLVAADSVDARFQQAAENNPLEHSSSTTNVLNVTVADLSPAQVEALYALRKRLIATGDGANRPEGGSSPPEQSP